MDTDSSTEHTLATKLSSVDTDSSTEHTLPPSICMSKLTHPINPVIGVGGLKLKGRHLAEVLPEHMLLHIEGDQLASDVAALLHL